MSKFGKFVVNGIILTLTALLMRTVSLAFNAYITKKVGAECIGLFSVIMSVYGFVVTLATSGINLASTRMVSEYIGVGDMARAKESLLKCLSYATFFGCFASFILFTFADPIGKNILGDERTILSLRIMSVSLLPIALSSCVNGYFTAVRRPAKNAVAQIFEQAMKIMLITYGLMLLMPSGIEWACVAMVAGGAVSEFLSFAFLGTMFLFDKRALGKAKMTRHRETTGYMLKISLPVALSSYVRSLLLTLEHILIPKRLTKSGKNRSEALASYGALHAMAIPIVLYPFSFIGAFSGLLVPEMSESMASGDRGRICRITEKAISATLLFSIGASAIMIVFSSRIGQAVYSSAEAGAYIALIAPVIPIMYLDSVVDSILKGIGEQVYSMGVNISDSAISIVLVWFILPVYGAKGYALVITVTEIYNFAMSTVRLQRKVGFRFSFIRNIIIPLLSSVFICRFCCQYIFANSVSTPISLSLQIFICASSYALLEFVCESIFKRRKKQKV